MESNSQLDLEGYKEWLMQQERAENTIQNYEISVKQFFQRYPEASKTNMLAFKKWLMESRKPKTANIRIVAMNGYCEYIGKPECCVKGIKIQKSLSVENVISFQEYERLRKGLLDDGDQKGYWIVTWLAKTGARVSEFVRLDKSCFDKGYCEMWTKGKMRRIFIPQQLLDESRSFFEAQDSKILFLNRYGKPYTTRGIASKLVRWGEKYGIRKEAMHPHSFRHLYAKEFLKRNSNISLLADLMGHSNVATTSIYLKMSREEQIAAFNEASCW